MSTISSVHEALPQSDEVIFPVNNLIDGEPFYSNFTMIENFLQQQQQSNTEETFRAVRISIDPESGESSPMNTTKTSVKNLIQIVEEIERMLRPRSPVIRDDQKSHETIFEQFLNNFNASHPMSSMKSVPKAMEKADYSNEIDQIYGFDDCERASPILSDDSSDSVAYSIIDSPPMTSQPTTINIQEYYTNEDKSRSMAIRSSSTGSSQSFHQIDRNTIDHYEDYLRHHPSLYQDPDPEIIDRSNPNEITYKQKIIIRNLIPPTPPPPGPLIIRETIGSCSRSPSPLIIEQKPSPPTTPSPIIIREMPPTPPMPSADEQPVLPKKPQSIIIEKWLPYKPAPPRQVIYERIIETPLICQFQPGAKVEQSSSAFDRFAQSTQQYIDEMERQTTERIESYQAASCNTFQVENEQPPIALYPLTTPTLVVNHPPVTRFINYYPSTAGINQNFYIPDLCYFDSIYQ